MARVHGKNSDFSINAVAIENELSQIVMTADVPEADITAFTDVYQNSLAGKKSVRYEIIGTFDPAAGAGDATLFGNVNNGGKVTTLFDVTGSGPGANDPVYTCTASGLTGSVVTSYRMDFPVGDKASYSATVQNSGSTTRAVA